MAIYRIDGEEMNVQSSEDYIALAKPVRYAKCVANTVGPVLYSNLLVC